jgi:hypothetical protein
MLVGGILSIGLAGVIDVLTRSGGVSMTQSESEMAQMETAEKTPEAPIARPVRIPGFGHKVAEAVGVATVATAVVAEVSSITKSAAAPATNSVADTIAALEQAKSDIKTALGGVEGMASVEEEPHPTHAEPVPQADEEAPINETVASDGELYVVEEKIIRGRPSRILSDDTVEAETEEGWMRFENFEHLNEYLDSLETDET